KTGDMTTFLKWYCQQVNKTTLTQEDFESQAYEFVKAFYPDGIHLQFQMEECHKMLTAQGSNHALSISKMKAASYPDFGLELLVPEQMWIDDVCTYDISAKYGISYWWFNRQKFYIDRHDSPSRRKNIRTYMRILKHTIAEKDFKNMYPSDFEDLNLLLLQGHLDHLPSSDKRMLSTAVKLWTQNLVIRQRTEKDVTRSKEFIAAIERRLKTRRIYWNLECFVGGRVRDIDFRLLQRTE
ncbi:hypothetical protein Tco_0609168, partial [Tanacetum coccineum]